jgi:hypothetical protein
MALGFQAVTVTLAKAEVQGDRSSAGFLDFRFRRNDE